MAPRFELEEFARAFVAALVEGNRSSIQPKNPLQRQAFHRILKFLDQQTVTARASVQKRDWLKKVVRIRNRMAPGQSGAFDQFETALRDLQLSLTESPNPNYEYIVFTVSKPFAGSVLSELDEDERALVRQAAELFLTSTASGDVDNAS